jgi:septal ring factor EnvC (AmiA/AmiB activator)
MGTPLVTVSFGQLDHSQPVQEQLEQLAAAIRNLESWFKPIRDDLHQLRQEIDRLRTLADSVAAQAIAHIEAKIRKLTADLREGQTLDLRWAIGGLLISAIGTFMQYWA